MILGVGASDYRVCMSEVRKFGEAGRHFSEVDSVSSQLFDRMSGDAQLTTDHDDVPTQPQSHPVSEGPFSEVDNVSSGIFDRMEAIEQPDKNNGLPSNAVSLFGNHVLPGETNRTEDDQPTAVPDGWVLVRADQTTGLASEAGQDADRVRPNPNSADITYKAAQRRSQLPDGAEPIEGAPALVNEDSMLESIRALMVEQKRDFNKKAFPELEPANPDAPVVEEQEDDSICEQVEHYEDVEQSRFKRALVKFVRTDTVLAICMSVWASLLLMIFIEPKLSQALAIISLILLGIFRLMQPTRKQRKVVRVVKRKRNNHDLALNDAILSQQA